MSEHEQTPWNYRRLYTDRYIVGSHDGHSVCECGLHNAAYIVRAVNAHAALVAACKTALEHSEKLREAWGRGALDEHELQLRAALQKAEATHA